VQITAVGQKFASESDFNRPKKNHSRCFSTFWVSTQPRSESVIRRCRLQCPLCPKADTAGGGLRTGVRSAPPGNTRRQGPGRVRRHPLQDRYSLGTGLTGRRTYAFFFSPYTIDLKRSSRRAEASAFGEVAHDPLTFKQRTMRSFPPERKFVEATDPFWTNLTIKTERPDLADIQFEPRGDVEQDVAYLSCSCSRSRLTLNSISIARLNARTTFAGTGLLLIIIMLPMMGIGFLTRDRQYARLRGV
jgi:hypothetical protein